MQIEAKTLALALIKAAKEYNCSAANLDFSIVQSPRAGLFGLFSKTAIIKASKKEASTKALLKTIEKELQSLFINTGFEIDSIKVALENKTIKLELISPNPSVLIGKAGHRYIALNQILRFYLQEKYRLELALEIGNFYKKEQKQLLGHFHLLEKELQKGQVVRSKPMLTYQMQIFKNIVAKRKEYKTVLIRENEKKILEIKHV